TFLLGRNGQGKSNLLEAAGLVTALRSFRTAEAKALVRHGQPQARLYFVCERSDGEKEEIELTLTRSAKQLKIDGDKVSRLADFLGNYPTVTLAAEDIQLIRGSPGLRRRFLDMTLSATSREYFEALRRYHRALQERNRLLKSPRPDTAQLNAFDKALAPEAVALFHQRSEGVTSLQQDLAAAYAIISDEGEAPDLSYRPKHDLTDEAVYLMLLKSHQAADLALKSTQVGPHRDELAISLGDKSARTYASDGQQRALVVSLRLAQLSRYEQATGLRPVVLADDVLGELDSERRKRFWQAIGSERQVIATGTEQPARDEGGRSWQLVQVEAGKFTAMSS
ncbi:MAG: DNA replication and repair protein RecF, partial [Verrucomicrobiota bacterium]